MIRKAKFDAAFASGAGGTGIIPRATASTSTCMHDEATIWEWNAEGAYAAAGVDAFCQLDCVSIGLRVNWFAEQFRGGRVTLNAQHLLLCKRLTTLHPSEHLKLLRDFGRDQRPANAESAGSLVLLGHEREAAYVVVCKHGQGWRMVSVMVS